MYVHICTDAFALICFLSPRDNAGMPHTSGYVVGGHSDTGV